MNKQHKDGTDEAATLLDRSSEADSSKDITSIKVKHHSMLIIIVALIFFSYCIDTLLFPFFPNTAIEKGLSSAEIGVVFAAFDFARFVTAPIAGSMFSVCHPKKLCAFGSMIAGAGCISFGVTALVEARRWFLISCVSIRCVAGIGSAMLNVAGTSLLMKASGYESPTIVALVETANVMGYGFGPALGAFLYKFGATSDTMGILFTIWSIICGVSTTCTANFVNKKYSAHLLLITYVISIPIILLLAPSPPISYLFGHQRYFVLSATMMGILAWFAPSFYILPFSMALQLARLEGYPEDSLHTYGLLTGLMNSGLCLGSTLGPVLSGVVADSAGFEWSEFMAASIITLMAVFHGSYLFYLKLTDQLSALVMNDQKTLDSESEKSDQPMATMIAEACSEKMKSCLRESVVSAKMQQPKIELTY
ncbi:MFS-type transporter SLC18B1-like [Watersipora subatra]|uniref:MFS-type transporter SLC18B1-like n=1 Tax=Watersipora subatra TaxID=2589382 RepID=UPI00355B7416